MTEWRLCPSPYSLYEASYDGEIRNAITGRVLKIRYQPDGFPRCSVSFDDGRKKQGVSPQRMVWAAFHGTLPSSVCVVFKNGDCSDLSVTNLDAVPRSEFNSYRARKRWKKEDEIWNEFVEDSESEFDEWIFNAVESEAERKARMRR